MIEPDAVLSEPCAKPALQLILLTHATEFLKATNTGQLVESALASRAATQPQRADHIQVQRVAWSRVAPDPQLLSDEPPLHSNAGRWLLLYPAPDALVLDADVPLLDSAQTMIGPDNLSDDVHPLQLSAQLQAKLAESEQLQASEQLRGFVILDATWQLAHKMYRQSPYLQQMPSVMLKSSQPSLYALRRNQRQQGWCTAESVALLLRALGEHGAAAAVTSAFMAFNQRSSSPGAEGNF